MEFGSGGRVLVYRDDGRGAVAVTELRRLIAQQQAAGSTPDEMLAVLIAAGELESAICDALFADGERADPRAALLRQLSIASARQYLAALDGRQDPSRFCSFADRLLQYPLPERIEIRPSEGYAYYGLFPEAYAESARRAARDEHPPRACVIGIRSIGTSLSAVAAAALEPLCEVTSCTVRPVGHPFERQLRVRPSFSEGCQREAQLGALFFVADEGPGLSGSSFASVVRTLVDAGVARNRIVLLPSWDPSELELRSASGRDVWKDHRRYVVSTVDCGVTPERAFDLREAGVDWSAGRWRRHVWSTERCWPAVQPQHERWKVHLPQERRLLKFAGLGRYGVDALDRATRLSVLGTAQAAGRLHRGFIDLAFVDGPVATLPFSGSDAEQVGRYVGRRAAEFGFGPPGDADALLEMIATNVAELRHDGTRLAPSALVALNELFASAPASDLDGRMLAHEWVRADGGLRKVDALDHGRDHFFPGPQNPAWDLAAAILELDLDQTAVRRLLDAYARASGDGQAADRLPAYLLAYAAFRGGYAVMARDACGATPDAARFEGMAATYRAHVRRLIPSVP